MAPPMVSVFLAAERPASGRGAPAGAPHPAQLREVELYEYVLRGAVDPDDPQRDLVSAHRGNCHDFLKRHQLDVALAHREGMRGLRDLAPYLFERIADARTLRLAWDFLSCKGGQAPGPNGHRFADYSACEVWQLCRTLAGALQDGTYRPGPERIRWEIGRAHV